MPRGQTGKARGGRPPATKAAARRRLRVPAAVFGALAVASAVVTLWVHDLVGKQEARLLRERGAAAGLILSSNIANFEPQLGQLGTAAGVADVSPGAFTEVAARQMAAVPAIRAMVVLRPTAEGFVVETAAGRSLSVGQVLDGARASAAERAVQGQKMVTTPVFSDGPELVVGFAIGPPAAPPGTVLYRESRILPGVPPRSAGSAPFAVLKAELYDGPDPSPGQLVLATAERPAPGDDTFQQDLPVGDSEWHFVVAAKHPLVGPLMAKLPWLVGAVNVVGSLVIVAGIEVLRRRRDYALALVGRRTAELRESVASLEVARQEAASARDQAMDASELKSQFLANMSHEIRTPLNGVIGMTGLLIDTRLDPEQREFAETIRRSGEALLEVINDVLDFSKIEAGKLELETSDFDLGAVLEDVAELFASTAHQKGLEITTSTGPGLPSMVVGDPGRVRQVLTNLVSNAVKFTNAGEVAIGVSMELPDDRPTARFSVRDTGVGIDETGQQRLFEAFTQADASTTRRYGGTGLGLAISKRLTEMMGGTLGVDSRVGAGSTFWFAIPIVPVADRSGPPFDPEALAGVRILIVDDNASSRAVLEGQVSAWGVEPVSAPDGPSGLRHLRDATRAAKAFDVVLLDWDMPGMDGPAVVRAIAQDASLTAVKVVSLAPVISPGTPHRRVSASLTKPVRRSQLFNSLASVLGIGARLPSSDRATSGADTWHAPPGLRALVVEDNQVNQRVVAAMLGRLGFRVDMVGNGSEAVAALAHLPYDVVLMDVQMPVMNGYEATGEIRRREAEGSHVPIVALTASAMKGDEEECLAAGMDAYLAKPVRIEDLADVLRSVLVPEETPWSGRPSPDPDPDPGDADLDGETLERVRALGEDLLSLIVSDFRTGAPNDIGEVKLGLFEADGPKVAGAAHRLKGGCLILGAPRMGALAAEIERQAGEGRLGEAADLVTALERSYADLVAALESV